MKLQVASLLIFASTSIAQVVATPPDGKDCSPIPLITLSENSTSVNAAPYQSNTSLFISVTRMKTGLGQSPHASSLVFKPQEAPHYLTQPGYLPVENGWVVSDDNKLMIAFRTDMGNGTIRCKDDGQRKLQSRFFLKIFGETQGHDLSVHCVLKMSHLATFLPRLFAKFKNTI
ncbi:phloretin hydrolase [Fusarium agapanthi]|uniref:Phloretin hydrolase n=1 Tax=Fusarium agapanthi TaxID=1803897 RepID=A0A9P5BK21_9HYPO|nr:phloretin hydrolase [Fusarium agapanthi]